MPRAQPPLNREQWAEAALDALAMGGPAAVAVEPLARALGVTKGSFYHHFSNREALIGEALTTWEARSTSGIFDRLRCQPPEARLEGLFLSAMDSEVDPRWGQLLTQLAAHRHDPLLGPVLTRVTTRRLEWLTAAWVDMGVQPDEAGRRALLAYTAYLGMVQLAASAPSVVPKGAALQVYVRGLVELLIRTPRSEDADEGA